MYKFLGSTRILREIVNFGLHMYCLESQELPSDHFN